MLTHLLICSSLAALPLSGSEARVGPGSSQIVRPLRLLGRGVGRLGVFLHAYSRDRFSEWGITAGFRLSPTVFLRNETYVPFSAPAERVRLRRCDRLSLLGSKTVLDRIAQRHRWRALGCGKAHQ